MKTREAQGGPPSAAVIPVNAPPENPPATPTSAAPASPAKPPPGRAKTRGTGGAKEGGAQPAAKRSGNAAKPTGGSKAGRRKPARRPDKAKAGASNRKPTKKREGMSGLDAAAKVLADSGKPMRCKEIVERVFAKGLWKTGGKTPAATINAAMIREIRDKGKQSRFRKAGRGLFASSGKGR